MPIINTVIAGGGTTPTGTKNITTNGTHDVAAYEYADVQVPTTAPAHYIEKTVDANGKLVGGTNVINLAGVTDIGSYALMCAYYGISFPANTSVDVSSLTTVSGQSGCSNMFQNCTGLTSVDLSSLTKVSGQSGCANMFNGCTSLTSADLSSLTTVSGQSSCNNMFYGCTSLTNIDLSSLTTVSGTNACQYMFQNCTGLTSIDLSSLTTVSGGSAGYYMFNACSNLASVDLSSLTTLNGYNSFYTTFNNCINLVSVDLSSLTSIGNNSCGAAFYGCKNLASISFPSITPNSFGSYTSQFQGLFNGGVLNITIHFPSNTQAKIETLQGYSTTAPFGATSGTVLFDLPATKTLTGADTVTYTRNPKYDTATSLAWKVGAYGTTNFTPAYYTSGTTDPAVGDTMYSDAACTTAVTTISAIA